MQGLPGVGQIQSVSVLQSGEQPSPPVWLPSSHVSAGGLSMPLPHGLDLHDPGGPSQDASVALAMSGVPPSRVPPLAASTTIGPPPCPPLPPVPLPETPAHPPVGPTASKAADQQAARNPG